MEKGGLQKIDKMGTDEFIVDKEEWTENKKSEMIHRAWLKGKEDTLEKIKKFALGLNGETHVDKAIKDCPCDACRIVNLIIEEETADNR